MGYIAACDGFGTVNSRAGCEKSDDFEARFGARSLDFMGTLAVGRDEFLEPGERHCLDYRRRHVVLDSPKVQCFTYDELVEDLSFRAGAIRLGGADEARGAWMNGGWL